GGLVSRARAHPEAGRHRAHVGHALGDDGNARSEGGGADHLPAGATPAGVAAGTPATPATAPGTTAGGPGVGRAQIAELGRRLVLPRVLEAHELAFGAAGHLGPAATRGALAVGRRLRSVATTVAATVAAAVTAAAARATAVALAALTDERQAHLALRVDVVDAHAKLVAQVDDVLHPLHALALAQLGDVDQAVAAGEDVDEGTELGDVHHPAVVHGAHLGLGRVEDQLDAAAGLLDGLAVLGADGHGAHLAVVVDGDVGPGLLLDGVDDLALGPDHLTDLVHGDLEADDLGRSASHLGPGLGDGLVHHVQDREPGLLGLLQRLGQHVGRE